MLDRKLVASGDDTLYVQANLAPAREGREV